MLQPDAAIEPSVGRMSHLASGIVAAWALVVLQFATLLIRAGGELSGVWEIQMAAVGLFPTWLLLAIVPGAVGGFLARCLFLGPKETAQRGRAFAALTLGAFALAVGYGVGGGRHLASLQARVGFGLALGLTIGAAVYALTPVLRTVSRRLTTPAILTLCASLILVIETANQVVLVRLYPAFHAGLSFLALATAGLGGALLATRLMSRARLLALAGLSGVLLLTVQPASALVAGFDNFRWVVAERSVTLNWGVEVASLLAPPPALDKSLAELPLGQRKQGQGADLRGRDILLISIDALRADHVGAYGYERPTTPAMDRLAEEGVLFEAAYAPTPHTSYSVTSLMTGKYMRPLLLQGAGADSDLWATLLQAYDYRTAAFYPPAVFFIDPARFTRFKENKLGFEYAWIEFAEGDKRVRQYQEYLKGVPEGRRVFTWVHLFGPHEPYEAHDEYSFGKRDIDLYDSEIRAADETVRRIVELSRKRDPKTVVILTADHGEEFGDHGGRYHGTTVYDEQVRVPMLISVPGLTSGTRVQEPVQTIDLLPTVLAGLQIPHPPRIRGRDLSPHLVGAEAGSNSLGRAVAETDDYTLLAEGRFRLICQRRSGACQLYDIVKDPGQKHDISLAEPDRAREMRERARSIAETHGTYESQGHRAEGKGWPSPIVLGISGNAEVAPTLAALLDDADVAIRRKAAELLFNLADTGQAPALRLAMTREEDEIARSWIALSLTRLGQGAPFVFELLRGKDTRFSRLAALALAEAGDNEGEAILVRWWTERKMENEMALRVLRAMANIRSKEAVPHLIASLKDVRLRPYIASSLAAIGDKDAMPHLALRLSKERYQSARLPLAEAVLALGGDDELIVPLRRFLGVPERLEGGVGLAQRAGILDDLGGLKEPERKRLAQLSDSGIRVSVVVPPAPDASDGVRLICRARSRGGAGGAILIEPAPPRIETKKSTLRARNQPEISSGAALRIIVPGAENKDRSPFREFAVTLPEAFGAKPGHHLGLEIFAPRDVELEAVAAVPLREDLPPPPPEPWKRQERENPPHGQKPSESDENPSP